MIHIIDRDRIRELLPTLDLIPVIEKGFVAYSSGQSVVPPVGELQLDKGEVHIKYGFIASQPYYVIKIASGFYGNPALGLSTSNGCMLLFSQNTGQLKSVLLDEGHLTDVRTAVAGAIAARCLAPSRVKRIGIVGTGVQARAQLKYLDGVVDCQNVLVWGRSRDGIEQFVADMSRDPETGARSFLNIETTLNLADIQNRCDLIVTTTPSDTPLLKREFLKPGTHITAVGSDMPHKQELETEILGRADVVVADSMEQCKHRGEISHAIRRGKIQANDIVELGNVLSGTSAGRMNDQQITIADLTGVAVQDIQIATATFQAHENAT